MTARGKEGLETLDHFAWALTRNRVEPIRLQLSRGDLSNRSVQALRTV